MTLYGELVDPTALAELEAAALERIQAEGLTGDEARAAMAEAVDGARLGRPPRKFRTVEERLEERLAAEPDAEPERREAIKLEVNRTQREAAGYFDLTFSPAKSVSIYHAGLLAQGRTAEAAEVLAAHQDGVAEALAYLRKEAGFSRAGYHGRSVDGRPSVGRYVDAQNWVAVEFIHHTSRAGEPQLHSHLDVLNRVQCADGEWRTLDSKALNHAKSAAAAIYERTYEESLEARRPVAFEMRPDGVARELVGITREEVLARSSRRVEVMAKRDEYVAAYKANHNGAEPTPYMLSLLSEQAALRTRSGKEKGRPLTELVAEWEAQALATETASNATLADRVEVEGIRVRLGRGEAVELAPEQRQELIRAGVEAVQLKSASWTRSELMFEMKQRLPESLPAGTNVAGLLDGLAEQALASRDAGVVQVAGLQLIDVSPALRRESDGRSVFRPGRDERYSTLEHLAKEERVLARARQTGGPALSPIAAEQVVASAGLVGDQAATTRGVLTDGRPISTVVGPGGAGKSFTQATIAAGWEQHAGKRVIGLAPSSVAAAVLAHEGVATTTNLDLFLGYAEGRGSLSAQAKYLPGKGDLVIVDESGMAGTEKLRQVLDYAEKAGAKVVLVGDHAQLPAVEAGGLFDLLAKDAQAGAYELETVRRFRSADGTIRQWEADASLELRAGNVSALPVYDAHGRLSGGTWEKISADAVEAYVADTVSGRDAVLITSTNDRAAELSGMVRAELTTLGRVEPEGVLLSDRTVAGRGDWIQTRENNNRLADSEGMPVYNRFVYEVTQRHGNGALQVTRVTGREADGTPTYGGNVTLAPDYVEKHVTLAYAGTVHAVQGRTVRRSYPVVDGAMTREAWYVANGRGWEMNRAFVETERGGDAEDPNWLRSTPMAELSKIMGRDSAEAAAVQQLRDGLDHAESLPALEPVWRDLVDGHTREEYAELIRDTLGEDRAAVLEGSGWQPLHSLLWESKLRGHDEAALLTEAVGEVRSLDNARHLGRLLHHRVERTANARTPEHEPAGISWLERTPQSLLDSPTIGVDVRAFAAAADDRVRALAERVAEQAPDWATDRLGPVPGDPLDRAEWLERAGTVAAYREAYGVDAAGTVIGTAPPRGAVDQRHAWEQAYTALGRPEEWRHVAQASDSQLTYWTRQYEMEKVWSPHHVADELRDNEHMRQWAERRATLAEVNAQITTDPDRRAELLAEAAAKRQLAGELRPAVAGLEKAHEARQTWYEETAETRETAEAARAELERRGLDHKPPTQPELDAAEQLQPEAEQQPEQIVEPEQYPELAPEAEPQAEVEQQPELAPAPTQQPNLAPEAVVVEEQQPELAPAPAPVAEAVKTPTPQLAPEATKEAAPTGPGLGSTLAQVAEQVRRAEQFLEQREAHRQALAAAEAAQSELAQRAHEQARSQERTGPTMGIER